MFNIKIVFYCFIWVYIIFWVFFVFFSYIENNVYYWVGYKFNYRYILKFVISNCKMENKKKCFG